MKTIVSVIVFVYNHEKYLDKNFLGIEKQEFNGKIEVIIHDDASSDGSAAICRNYAKESRHSVKIICQSENKYSKRISVWPEILSHCSGDYIALCEGDDYWIDPLKISRQLKALEILSSVDICFHKVFGIHWQSEEVLRLWGDYGELPKLFSASEVIKGDGHFMPTASLFFRRKVLDCLPEWFFDPPPIGDYYLQVFGAINGGAIYLPMCAAAYRMGDPESWSQVTIKNIDSMNQFDADFLKYLLKMRDTLGVNHYESVDELILSRFNQFFRRCYLFKKLPESVPVVHLLRDYHQKKLQKILIACDFFWPSIGGLERMAETLGVYLQSKGYVVTIATSALPHRTGNVHHGMEIISLDRAVDRASGFPYAKTQLAQLICSGQYRSCILLADPLNWVLWALESIEIPDAVKVFAQPLINQDGYNVWGGNKDVRQRIKSVLMKAHGILALTRSGVEINFFQNEKIPYIYLPNATDIVPHTIDFRGTYGVPADRALYLMVANIWPVKNHIALLGALDFIDWEYTLVLIGHPSSDTDYMSQFEQAVRANPNVLWIPGADPSVVSAAMDAADIILLASKGEVSPVTLIEAMSHRKAWLATPECGSANDMLGGIISPLQDFPLVLKKLYQSPETSAHIGDIGYRYWRSCLTWEVIGPNWESLIDKGKIDQSFEPEDSLRIAMGEILAKLTFSPARIVENLGGGFRSQINQESILFGKAKQGFLDIVELVKSAESYLASNQNHLAIDLYRTWLDHTQSPLRYAIYFNLGVVLQNTGDYSGAEQAYRQAITINPEFTSAHTNLAYLAALLAHQYPSNAPPMYLIDSQSQNLLVTVIIPTFNRPELLKDAVQSVIVQNYPYWEIIVVNDAGEEVLDCLAQFSAWSHQIHYIHHEENRGLSAARNTGLKLAKGEIICFLDDDDRFLDNHLEIVVAGFHQSETRFVYTEARYIQEILENGKRVNIAHSEPYQGIEYSRDKLLVKNYIPVNTWAIRRELALQAGPFDESLTALEDWEFLLRLTELAEPRRIGHITVEVRSRPTNRQHHMSARERERLPLIYQAIYSKHPAPSPKVQAERETLFREAGLEIYN